MLQRLRDGVPLGRKEKISMVLRLAFPSMLAQISYVINEYIDAAMVGALGASATAAVGLVMTSLWLLGGLSVAAVSGFSAPLAIEIGAKDERRARELFFEALVVVSSIAVVLGCIGALLYKTIPAALGGKAELLPDASAYLLISSIFLPAMALDYLCAASLQCLGDMKTPSVISSLTCVFDICFNFILIYEPRVYDVFGVKIPVFGFGMGVRGAALGTGLAYLASASWLFFAAVRKGSSLRFRKGEGYKIRKSDLLKAVRISVPVAVENVLVQGAQVVSTRIISPGGTLQIAANSIAVTAEGLCYMPGFGVRDSAAALVGQSIGAGRTKEAVSFGKLTVALGMLIQGGFGVVMYLMAPEIASLLTPDQQVVALAARCMRVVAFAEPLYAAAIVGAGVFRGAEDTLVPSLLDFCSLWAVRIPLALYLASLWGVVGFWTAMSLELYVRGGIFLARLFSGR